MSRDRKRGTQYPYRTNLTRGSLFKPRQNMGCKDFNFNLALARALGPSELLEKVTHLPHAENSTRGDVLLNYPGHPDRMGQRDAVWFYDMTNGGQAIMTAALEANKPVLGAVNLQYVITDDAGDHVISHLISYVLRKNAAGTNELILLEPYDTDVLVKTNEGIWLGQGLRPGWREDIKMYFENRTVSEITLYAPIAGKPLAEYDLTKKDAGEGQCASWAIQMLEAIAVLDVRTVSPEVMFATIRGLQKGGRRHKTRRSKRTKRRGTRHARVR